MAGVDILNQFPSSKMAAAVKLGQSRFITVDAVTTTMMAVTTDKKEKEVTVAATQKD